MRCLQSQECLQPREGWSGSGAPLGAGSCASYAGRCDDSTLSAVQKATLLLHCPATCAGTVYADGGIGYCPCAVGRECCFDEPDDCDRGSASSGTVIRQVMRRQTLGLCKTAEAAEATHDVRRRAQAETPEESCGRLNADMETEATRAADAATSAARVSSEIPLDPVAMRRAAREMERQQR